MIKCEVVFNGDYIFIKGTKIETVIVWGDFDKFYIVDDRYFRELEEAAKYIMENK